MIFSSFRVLGGGACPSPPLVIASKAFQSHSPVIASETWQSHSRVIASETWQSHKIDIRFLMRKTCQNRRDDFKRNEGEDFDIVSTFGKKVRKRY